MRILSSTLTTKAKGICKGPSKQSPDLKNYTRPGPLPTVLKFLDPPLVNTTVVDSEIIYEP